MQTVPNENVEKQNIFLRVLLSICRVLLIAGLLLYVLYHLTNGFSAEMKTETVRLYTEELFLDSEGVIVRSEIPVRSDGGGVVSYRFASGERVSKGARLAMVYSGSQNAETVARVAEIDKTIDLLESADINGETQISDGIAAGREISDRLSTFSDLISRGDYESASEESVSMLKAFVRRESIISDSGDDVAATLASLKAERESLASTLSGTSNSVYASAAGYFYDNADGAEGVFDYSSVTSLTPSEYSERVGGVLASVGDAIGKIVTQAKWYFVCPVTKDESIGLTVGKKYEISFGMSDMCISMTLDAKNEEGSDVLLIFSSIAMPEDFDYKRVQKVSIMRDTVSGYRVPSSALRIVDGTVGVYIRSGNTVKFRVADVIYESGAYSFISDETEGKTLYSSDTDETNDVYCKGLALYDNVIISGAKELFPDRIVN